MYLIKAAEYLKNLRMKEKTVFFIDVQNAYNLCRQRETYMIQLQRNDGWIKQQQNSS
ncbi:unnamed protein product [Paramecium sonneborni]|uniref:Uncharacterized protein n=1 Tax=Paramecium sonneborni TaxID=65129 RepID=A0A8S1R3G5_9CILI|nr:unnamed protein product [Paramecium sonneborni]